MLIYCSSLSNDAVDDDEHGSTWLQRTVYGPNLASSTSAALKLNRFIQSADTVSTWQHLPDDGDQRGFQMVFARGFQRLSLEFRRKLKFPQKLTEID